MYTNQSGVSVPSTPAYPPAPNDGICPTCESEDGMVLVKDKSHYQDLEFKDGQWVASEVTRVEAVETHDAVRMFCPCCGEYFQIPEELCES